MCGRTCACEIHSEKCVQCAARFRVCDHTFAHLSTLFGTKRQKKLFFVLIKNYSIIFYPVLKHPFLLWNLLSCFTTAFHVLERPILF